VIAIYFIFAVITVLQITIVNIVIVTFVGLYELIKIRINYAIINGRDCMIYICN